MDECPVVISPEEREKIITTYLADARGRNLLCQASVNVARRRMATDPAQLGPRDVELSIDLLARIKDRLDGTDTLDRVALFSTLGDLRAFQEKIAGRV